VEGKKKDANGIYTWSNHPEYISYSGEFSNDFMNGRGILKKKNGTTIEGIFNQGNI